MLKNAEMLKNVERPAGFPLPPSPQLPNQQQDSMTGGSPTVSPQPGSNGQQPAAESALVSANGQHNWPTHCEAARCNAPLTQPPDRIGRPALYCSDACRQWQWQQAHKHG